MATTSIPIVGSVVHRNGALHAGIPRVPLTRIAKSAVGRGRGESYCAWHDGNARAEAAQRCIAHTLTWLAIKLLATLLSIRGVALAQTGLGSITGTVNDPSGARVENAVVKATNAASGWADRARSTSTGNYWVPEVPYGTYEITVSAPGFKEYVRKEILVGVGQIVRIDVSLELGVSSETVSVAAPSPLLKTETGDVTDNVSVQALDQVPMLSIGTAAAGSSGIRNPNNVLWIVPGTYYAPNSNVKINGAPTNSEAYSVEGMDATNQGFPYSPAGTQPGVDAIEEVSVKTSNFAPEFGAAGGGYLNVTMRSGTNSFHGTAYDYFVNEALNSATPFTGYPFTSSVPGTPHVKPRARRNDYGLTGGGPVRLPGIYNGRDSTFFFATFEQFRETQIINNIPATVPTAAYRTGDFSGAIAAAGNQVLGSDPLGRPILQNEIYDPSTQRTVNGELIADPFPDNTIPASRLDPVALKIQNLLPLPNLPGSVNNFLPSYLDKRVTTIPSIKIDQRTGDKGQLSFYWSMTRTDAPYDPLYGAPGIPISNNRRSGNSCLLAYRAFELQLHIIANLATACRRGLPAPLFQQRCSGCDLQRSTGVGPYGSDLDPQFSANYWIVPCGALRRSSVQHKRGGWIQ